MNKSNSNRYQSNKDHGRNRNNRGRDAQPVQSFDSAGPSQRGPTNNVRREEDTRPPRQANVAPGVPVPQHRVTSSSSTKNDPLFLSALNAVPGSKLHPSIQSAKVYPSAAGLTELVDQLHCQFVASSPGYARRVPKVAFAYYAATATYASMLKKVELNSFRISEPERNFANVVIEMNLDLPKVLQLYCEGFGSVQIPSGRLNKMDMAPREYVDNEESATSGWFGQVTHLTHWMYRDYPNLASYAYAINRAIVRQQGEPLEYQYPEAISPAAAHGNPTKNFLGYSPTEHLRPDQRSFLNASGFTQDGAFKSANEQIPLITNLLWNVQQELNQIKICRQKMTFTVDGSQAQIPVVAELPTEGLCRTLEGDFEVQSPCDIVSSCVMMSSAFAYRVKYAVQRNGPAQHKWAIYTCNNYSQVPQNWVDSANTLRNMENQFLQSLEMRTGAYGLVARVRTVLDATMAPY